MHTVASKTHKIVSLSLFKVFEYLSPCLKFVYTREFIKKNIISFSFLRLYPPRT